MVNWLQGHEQRLFCFINQRIQHRMLSRILGAVTHLGGATFTIVFSMLLILLGSSSWKEIGFCCLVALAASHIPVAIIKRLYPRLRPYLVLPGTITGRSLLTDHSFPSGHTTAIFSVTMPIMLFVPVLSGLLLPLALLVGLSRIYLGLHYPSDVIVGAIIGAITAIFSVALIG